jgi:phosphocarrier protein HPr
MISKSVTVGNRLGLHARAAARFVHLASGFQSKVHVTRGSQTMDGKSIMGILLLAAANGSVLTISAEGTDEVAAVDALCSFIESGFGEGACTV